MNNYVFGIGGTGAKCTEALTYLAASGVLGGNLYVRFIDKDIDNGSLERARLTLDHYVGLRSGDRPTNCDFLRVDLHRTEPLIWSPMEGLNPDASLDDLLQYGTLATSTREEDKAFRVLYETLYSKRSRQVQLNWGFLGRPSIGAAVFAREFSPRADRNWSALSAQIDLDIKSPSKPRLFLFGSIFGGTGAAGIPTIARIMRKTFGRDLKIGVMLMLPYFSFQPDRQAQPAGPGIPDPNVSADSRTFMQSATIALDFYYDHYFANVNPDDRIFDAVYYAGDPNLATVQNFARGSSSQRNEPHFIELVAALAAADFFARKDIGDNYHFLAGHVDENRVLWSDLPVPQPPDDQADVVNLRQSLGTLAIFSFAYLSYYRPFLENLRVEKAAWRAPWFVDHFKRKELVVPQNLGQPDSHLKAFCENYLEWLAQVDRSVSEEYVQWIDFDALAREETRDGKRYICLKRPVEGGVEPSDPSQEWDPRNLELLLLAAQRRTHAQDEHALHRIWEFLSNESQQYTSPGNLGPFISRLFRSCAKYFNSQS